MAGSTFKTNPLSLKDLLRDCGKGKIQLPDFQRSWVWDENRLKSLVASVSEAFPIGALMTLQAGGETKFKPRPIEGTPKAAKSVIPDCLLLDGQQRMTSLYQMTLRNKVVETVTARQKKVNRWFYIDIVGALDLNVAREEAIIGLPESKISPKNAVGRKYDLSTDENEYRELMFPLSKVFDFDDWQDGYNDCWNNDEKKHLFRKFKKEVIANFSDYHVPVIELDKSTSKEAVCIVFEKVNTGGKALDAFELVTAMYAAEGHELRKDWYGEGGDDPGRAAKLSSALRIGDDTKGILSNVASTDFLQAISLFHTRELRRAAATEGKTGKELPQITGNRHALLNLPLSSYKNFQIPVEDGFMKAAQFLHRLNIFRVKDLPYQTQVTALAAILADFEEESLHTDKRQKLERWFWCGIFGQLYGSAVDTRIARDFSEVTAWLRGGEEPSTVSEATFHKDRLLTMRMRLSAAYKGVNVLLMKEGTLDLISGQQFGHTTFFDDNVDIHHIFPQAWCKKQGISYKTYDSIINKTPLSARTNRIIGGDAPSMYLAKLENGSDNRQAISREKLDKYLVSHLIDPDLLRADGFDEFMKDRQKKLLALIENAMGVKASDDAEEGEDSDDSELILELAE